MVFRLFWRFFVGGSGAFSSSCGEDLWGTESSGVLLIDSLAKLSLQNRQGSMTRTGVQRARLLPNSGFE